MKKILLLVLITSNLQLLTSNCNAQYVTIPDTTFAAWLKANGLDSCLTGNQLDTTCPALAGITNISLVYTGITNLTGIQYFKSLDSLNCSGNGLTTLPSLPSSLTWLNCSDNQLDSLPGLPPSLSFLACNENQLAGLPALPAGLSYLDCSINLLTALPALPATLQSVNCVGNQLMALPALPVSLIELLCGNNLLSSLPALPNSLTHLDCYSNALTILPALPPLLDSLYCVNNLLASLPALPNSLNYLDCSFNQISYLPTLPNSLYYLSCPYNQLVGLPTLPDSMAVLDIQNNTALTCFPVINIIGYLNFYSDTIKCAPDYGQVALSLPPIDSLPLCDTFNPSGCTVVSGIQKLQVAGFRLQVYPNPTSGMVDITLPGNANDCEIEVLNVLGQKLFDSKRTTQDTRQPLDMSSFAAGIYFIRVSTAGATQTVKVVKE